MNATRKLCLGSWARYVTPGSTAILRNRIQEAIYAIHEKNRIPVLIIDEADLLRPSVFTQLHTLANYNFDSEAVLPIILAGQEPLHNILRYPSVRSFSSRIMGISRLKGISLDRMKEYLAHHLKLAGVDIDLFDPTAVTAIHQSSGGLFRTANAIATGALIAGTISHKQLITSEHVRIAASEIIKPS